MQRVPRDPFPMPPRSVSLNDRGARLAQEPARATPADDRRPHRGHWVDHVEVDPTIRVGAVGVSGEIAARVEDFLAFEGDCVWSEIGNDKLTRVPCNRPDVA